ncbi:MAG: AAA family ATPase [Treponema sp.]|nr:AAA family ATPase [Treponema sp.]
MAQKRNLPIGIQTFEDIRTMGCVYVDKTAFVAKLAGAGKPYFLSRPRRFGKSLFLSTLRSYFEGRKDLFEGLAVSRTETEWKQYPVLYFDFTGKNYASACDLKASLDDILSGYEAIYGKNTPSDDVEIRFRNLIKAAHDKTGSQVVVLVDEYDKPLLQNVTNEALEAEIRAVLKGFYGNLKGEDAHIRFVFITGVTRFDKVSIFSDLNNLNDISLNREFTAVCGITQEEMETCFGPEIERMSEDNGLSKEECLALLKKNYDGYHFSKNVKTDVYNPFSLLNAFSESDFGSYWFSTGTPTFLTKMMLDIHFDYRTLEEGLDVDGRSLEEYRLNASEPVPLLYQTGYLTIKSYEKEFESYTIALPNEEVKYGLYKRLLPLYAGFPNDDKKIEIVNFLKEIRAGKVDEFMERINTIFASAPKPTNQKQYELNCQAFVWLIFKLMGKFILCEVQNGRGRSDAVIWEKDIIYIFEFKMDGSAKEALEQIDDKDYLIAYKNDGRKIVKIGVNYSSAEKQLTEWIIG